MVRGGGPQAAVGAAPPDPALVALLGLFDTRPATTPAASPLQQLQAAILRLFAGMRSALPDALRQLALPGVATAPPAAPAPGSEPATQLAVPAPPQHAPAPESAPWSATPSLGTPSSADPAGDSTPLLAPAAGSATTAPPSSWLPIAGMRFRSSTRGAGSAALRRIDALLDASGVTRGQLVLLTFVAPFVVAFLIQAVAAILDRA